MLDLSSRKRADWGAMTWYPFFSWISVKFRLGKASSKDAEEKLDFVYLSLVLMGNIFKSPTLPEILPYALKQYNFPPSMKLFFCNSNTMATFHPLVIIPIHLRNLRLQFPFPSPFARRSSHLDNKDSVNHEKNLEIQKGEPNEDRLYGLGAISVSGL